MCTWHSPKQEKCGAYAVKDEVADDGTVFARLCQIHSNLLSAALHSHNAKHILAAWISAQGGPKVVAQRMVDE